MNESIEHIIAKKIKEKGGKTYYVGGFVRDLFLDRKTKDIDIEVHGISPNELYEILSELVEPLSYGKQFGVYSLKGYDIDIAMPRKEKATGKGHKDFEVYIDPYINLNDAIKRRDFTINAIYKDVLTDEIIDPFNGVKDIENKLIKHIDSNSFVEDPLRVLRACQFASRFNFTIVQETINLCKKMDITNLSKERVEEELKKALLQSEKPSIFFEELKQMNQLNYWFDNVNTNYIDQAKQYLDNINNKYEYLLCALSINTSFDVTRFTNSTKTIKYVNNMMSNLYREFVDDIDIYKTFNKLEDINDYIYLKILIDSNNEYLFEKHNNYISLMNKPYVTGKDLIELGYESNKYFNEALDYATLLRLQGVDKKQALKLINEYIKKISN